jgi:hypothetical protein
MLLWFAHGRSVHSIYNSHRRCTGLGSAVVAGLLQVLAVHRAVMASALSQHLRQPMPLTASLCQPVAASSSGTTTSTQISSSSSSGGRRAAPTSATGVATVLALLLMRAVVLVHTTMTATAILRAGQGEQTGTGAVTAAAEAALLTQAALLQLALSVMMTATLTTM